MFSKYGITDIDCYNQKKRELSELVYFTDWHGILLNISYIYPNFALMCTPSVKDIYKRNDIRIVQDFIHERHGSHFYLFNVHIQDYDTKVFDDKVIFMPFPDHCSPRISYFEKASEAISKVFDDDPQCTIFVHCKAGRGRSGTVVCAYQIYSKNVLHVDEAISKVNEKRSPQNMSITIPSQIRFLHYFEQKCLKGDPISQRINIEKVEFYPEFNREMNFSVTRGIPYEDKEEFTKKFDGHSITFTDLQFSNEFVLFVSEINGKSDCVRIQLHSDYLTSENEKVTKFEGNKFIAHFDKMQLDGPHNRKTSKNFPPDFSMNLYYTVL
ncbi:hypothetical protein M9Y10_001658 [Tritrichomonas musculus]|uniref:Phosphatidylinositol-3,4,5-trisphosphate 3-phosphatase n=1 Tax=Tritrichomonas musculus TaxID=1915356 RepID=A0ABR2L7Q5_9EUKA